MEQQNLVFNQISFLVEFVTEPGKHWNQHMKNERHLLCQLLRLWSPQSHREKQMPGSGELQTTASRRFHLLPSPAVNVSHSCPSHLQPQAGSEPQLSSTGRASPGLGAAAPRNPRATRTSPWRRGQGESPEHSTGRITALKVIFTYSACPSPEELALGTAVGSCSNKPGAQLQKGF